MPIRPDDAAKLARGVRHMFAESETVILAKIARALAQGLDAPDWAEHKLAGIRAVTGDIDRILYDLDKGLPGAVDEAMNLAYNRGRSTAGGELAAAGVRDTVAGSVQTTGAVAALTRDTLGRVEPMLLQIQRASLDIYRHTIAQTTAQVLSGTQTRREASRAALGKLSDAGITGFRDRAGRKWDMASYAEMATRTSSAQAMRQGHVDRITDLGVDLVSISDAPEECEICRPYEGKILSVSGAGVGKKLDDGKRVSGSLSGAITAGLFHPNAILGDHDFQTVGTIENAVRAWYDGPSVELRTARGIRLTVSPHHPVLTSRGWVDAERLSKGDELFSPANAGDSMNGSKVSDELDHMQPRVEDTFDALRSVGKNARVPAACDDLHGDGKFCQGEIDIVMTDDGLLPVSDAEGVQQCGHRVFGGPNTPAPTFTGDSTLDFRLDSVRGPVRGALAYAHAGGLEPTAQGRIADSEDVGEVLAGLPGAVEVDELVEVNFGSFQGYAYDFQTSFGAYAVNSILVHNCRHSQSAYIVGVSTVPKDTEDVEGDKLRQQQRAYERRIRELKRRDAIDHEFGGPQAQQTRMKLRAKQAEMKAFIEDNNRKSLPYRTSLTAR